jgi:phage replication O-like protein O
MDESTTIASPQAENGHIDIAHELAEAFYKLQLSGYQWHLLWVIFRQTYGWKKKQDRISITFFQQRTGIDKRNIAHSLSDLTKRKIIVKNNNGFIVSYGIQKDYVKWIYKPLLKSTTRRNKAELSQEDIQKPLLKSPVVKSTTKPLLKA